MAVLAERFDTLEEKLDSILRSLDDMPNRYVSNERFKPVEQFYRGALGVATLILIAILALVLAHVIPGFSL